MPSQSISVEMSVFDELVKRKNKKKFSSYTDTIADALKRSA